MSKTIGVLGCGWLGFPLAQALLKDGYTVHGSTTSDDKLGSLDKAGITPFLIRLSPGGIEGDIQAFLRGVSILVINVPPRLRGNKGENYLNKLEHLRVQIRESGVKKIIFASSTSVYGDQEGQLDENSPPNPKTESGRQLLAAENLFREDPDLRTTIIRFGGLIGEDRHPISQLAGRTDLRNGHHPVNLIHQTDAVSLIQFIIHNDHWNKIINGVAPEHPTKQEYYRSEALKRNLLPPEYQPSAEEKPGKQVDCKYFPYNKYVFLTSIFS
ncbi:SDR family oxidoreductase [Zeaxanthinibacter enoshimensis]|uniref:SDR family oxidoreductase n=1 Tax=Zeaxanthinibacter enoshimensis TaxID=392009 RepID=UPI0035686B4C